MVCLVRLPRRCWVQGTQGGAVQHASLLHTCRHIYSLGLLLRCFLRNQPYLPFLLYSDISKWWFCLISAKIPDCGKISGIGRSWIFGRGVSWVQIICARLTLSRPPHTRRLTGGAGHQLDGIRLHFSSKSQPIRGCFYAADNLAIGCKWKDGANALAPVRTAPKHQRLFSEKILRKT